MRPNSGLTLVVFRGFLQLLYANSWQPTAACIVLYGNGKSEEPRKEIQERYGDVGALLRGEGCKPQAPFPPNRQLPSRADLLVGGWVDCFHKSTVGRCSKRTGICEGMKVHLPASKGRHK